MDSFAPFLSAPMAQMGTTAQDDPFNWDLETVTRELQSRPWVKSPAALAAKLAEEDVDGQTLLTYEITFSRQELHDALEITTARSKAGLAEAILSFQARSGAFRLWKANRLRLKNIVDSKEEIPLAPFATSYVDVIPSSSLHGIPAQHHPKQGDEVEVKPLQDATSLDGFIFESDGDCMMQTMNGDAEQMINTNSANDNASSSLEFVRSPTPAQPREQQLREELQNEEQPVKRRRLAPTNLSTAYSDAFAPTQSSPSKFVDTIEEQSDNEEHKVITIPPEHAYLGEKGRPRQIILSQVGSPDAHFINLRGGGFAVASSDYIIPPGKRIATNRFLQKRLRRNSKDEMALKRDHALVQSSARSNRSESIIDLDDLPDYWDEETQREIDEENAEIAAREQLAHNLSKEQVESILKDEMAAMEAKWKETKLPKYNLKAYQLWVDSRRKENTKKKIIKLLRGLKHYEPRIRKLFAEILDNTWQTERDVRTQAGVIEQSLTDKLYDTWLIELLEKRNPPPKPLGVLRPKPKPSTSRIPLDPFEDEVLTSDEEEFILPDDNDDNDALMLDEEPSENALQSLPLRLTCEPSHPPSDVESDMIIDLTQLDSPETLKDSKAAISYIDLTSPVKREPGNHEFITAKLLPAFGIPEEVPAMDSLGSLRTIGELPTKHWSKQKDRWRLVLCILWRLTQTRREWLLRLIQDNTPEDAWKVSVLFHQMNPLIQQSDIENEKTKTVAFDVTKLFLSYLQCRLYKHGRVVPLSEKDNNRLKLAQSDFPTFHYFIKQWAPQFPQSSQIFRTDTFDEEIGPDDADTPELNNTNTPSRKRKRVVKEIVQNKEGVDLREREMKRAAELEARRLKLRAALATSNTISVDKSRLIINESKQDDQSFIYVNDEIGKLIKDHQIDGVRFLWEQIVLDDDTKKRQGCLLAHTMGLGKTMQVITFLVTVLEAANSSDESVKAQVPKELRMSKSLILCPAGLVDNWLDEILMWSPEGLLGNIFKIESALKPSQRMLAVQTWERDGGVLVIGHTMFSRSPVDLRKILTQAPNIVICDEAHVMKNPTAEIHRACQEFRTTSRIALTGSPLSNNILEYYCMIDWVAPNFLGPREEFGKIYVDPIQRGLWRESSGPDKRKALKMLEVLKMNVAPKVQRATTQSVRHELPGKYEFVIYVEPTPLQKQLYDLYLTEIAPELEENATVKGFGPSDNLRLICNHPSCFRQKVKEEAQTNAPGLSKSSTIAQEGESSEKEDSTNDDSGNKAKTPARKFSQNLISSVLKETNKIDIDDITLSRKVELLLMILDEARALEDKTLVFSQSLHTLNYLENLFKQQRRAVCRLDGSTVVSKRQEQIKSFNTGKQEIYLISTEAGGVGLNIYGANRVVIFDFKWNPVKEQQAVGRAYRFGQEKTVFVYQFVVSGAFEEALQNRTVFKTQLAARVVDKKKPVSWGKRFGNLLQPLAAKPARDLKPFLGRDTILDRLIEHAQPGGIIREIVSTDTFEEEDPTNELTAEERRDAQELHDIERVKHTDPEKYRMMMNQKERADQIRAMAAAAAMARANVSPSNQPTTDIASLAHSKAAAPNASTEQSTQTQAASDTSLGLQTQSSPQGSSSAPLPMTGANTHIRTSNTPSKFSTTPSKVVAEESGTGTSPGRVLRSSASKVVAPAGPSSLFSQPRSQAKSDFEKELTKVMVTEPKFRSNAKTLAKEITDGIALAQREQGHGFLPNDARWRFLLTRIQRNRRFLHAVIWASCNHEYLATASEEEIQRRITTMNSQSEKDFSTQLRRTLETPDPSNLNNLHRSEPQSARGSEDTQIMRRAADTRTDRRFRQPRWAINALQEPNNQT